MGLNWSERSLKLLAALSAALFTALTVLVACVSLQVVIPHIVGPDFLLIRYSREVVAIDLVGGVIPLVMSVILISVVQLTGLKKNDRGAFRKPGFWLGVMAIALVSTDVFTLAFAEYGGLELPVSWSIALIPGGSVIGVALGLARGNDVRLAVGVAECYVVGTLAMLLSDLLRTLSGLTSAPVLALGGDGIHDLVFWFGIYTGLSYFVFRFAYPILARGFAISPRVASGP